MSVHVMDGEVVNDRWLVALRKCGSRFEIRASRNTNHGEVKPKKKFPFLEWFGLRRSDN